MATSPGKLEHPSRRGGTRDPRTINHHLELLGRIFRVACKWKLIWNVPEIGLLEAPKPEFDFLDFDEAEAFVAKPAPEWHPFAVVAMRTGLRVGELAGSGVHGSMDVTMRYAHLSDAIGDELSASPRRRRSPATTPTTLLQSRGTEHELGDRRIQGPRLTRECVAELARKSPSMDGQGAWGPPYGPQA